MQASVFLKRQWNSQSVLERGRHAQRLNAPSSWRPALESILWAEDNTADQRLIRLALESMPNAPRVKFVADGKQFLAALQQARPQLAVVDLNMPGMHGLELIGCIRSMAEHRDLPIIVFTSSMNLTELAACHRLGAAAIVHKPMQIEAYDRAVARIVGRRGTQAPGT